MLDSIVILYIGKNDDDKHNAVVWVEMKNRNNVRRLAFELFATDAHLLRCMALDFDAGFCAVVDALFHFVWHILWMQKYYAVPHWCWSLFFLVFSQCYFLLILSAVSFIFQFLRKQTKYPIVFTGKALVQFLCDLKYKRTPYKYGWMSYYFGVHDHVLVHMNFIVINTLFSAWDCGSNAALSFASNSKLLNMPLFFLWC